MLDWIDKHNGWVAILSYLIFIVGFILGFQCATVIYKAFEREPAFEELYIQVDALKAEIYQLRKPVKTMYEQAGTARLVMEETIQIGRKEVNDYNRAGAQ